MGYTSSKRDVPRPDLASDAVSSSLKLAWVRPEEMIVVTLRKEPSTRRKRVDVCAPHVPLVEADRERQTGEGPMQVVHQRWCGLDVHNKTVVACIVIMVATGEVQKQVRTFSTMTADLLALADWLRALQVTPVAMESTGVLGDFRRKRQYSLQTADEKILRLFTTFPYLTVEQVTRR